MTGLLFLAPLKPLLADESLTPDSLYFGNALYQHFQRNSLQAITRIEVAQQQNRLTEQQNEAQLLLGALYFDYGLTDEALTLFKQLLEDDASSNIRDQVWFNLARINYQFDQTDSALEYLNAIEGKLPEERENEKYYLLSRLQFNAEDTQASDQAVRKMDRNSPWYSLALYNLGIAANKPQYLQSLLNLSAEDEETLQLLNLARLNLGLNAYRQQQPQLALDYLLQLPLDNPLSNRALLAGGWSYFFAHNQLRARQFWNTLIDRQQPDHATEEARLAIAYAEEQWGNSTAAINAYRNAADRFSQTIELIDLQIEQIEQGALLKKLDHDQTKSIPFASQALYPLFASTTFQQAVADYLDLLNIQTQLQQWSEKLPVYQIMLNERETRFEQKLPLLEPTTIDNQIDALQKQRDTLALQLQTIENNHDLKALASEDELDLLDQLDYVESLIESLQSRRDVSDEQQRLKLLSGILNYSLETQYPQRVWQHKKSLLALDRSLETLQLRRSRLLEAVDSNQQTLQRLQSQIDLQSSELHRLLLDTQTQTEQQGARINTLAIDQLKQFKQQITQYRLSALYARASLLDRLTNRSSSP